MMLQTRNDYVALEWFVVICDDYAAEQDAAQLENLKTAYRMNVLEAVLDVVKEARAEHKFDFDQMTLKCTQWKRAPEYAGIFCKWLLYVEGKDVRKSFEKSVPPTHEEESSGSAS